MTDDVGMISGGSVIRLTAETVQGGAKSTVGTINDIKCVKNIENQV